MSEEHIQLSADAKSHIQGLIGEGNFASASEYVECLIREDQLTRQHLDGILEGNRSELEKRAIEGLDSGEAIEVNDAYWDQMRQNLRDNFGVSKS